MISNPNRFFMQKEKKMSKKDGLFYAIFLVLIVSSIIIALVSEQTVWFSATIFLILCVISKNWKKIITMAAGWGIMEAIDFLYDFPFWIWLQFELGVLWGSVVASIGALIINMGFFLWYQKMGIDWFGVEAYEELKEKGKNSKFISWALKYEGFFTFFVFSIFQDSFKTTVFMRKGRFGKIERKDMKIFIVSTIISCTAWSFLMSLVGEIIKKLFLRGF